VHNPVHEFVITAICLCSPRIALELSNSKYLRRRNGTHAVPCLTTSYTFNGKGKSRFVPDQTSNAYTRRDTEDWLLV
jgi:hypothetical protein